MFSVQISPAAEKQLKDIPKRDQIRIVKRISLLAKNPLPDGVKKLKGLASLYRIRQGDWRIVYTIEEQKLIILVLKVGHRKNIYR